MTHLPKKRKLIPIQSLILRQVVDSEIEYLQDLFRFVRDNAKEDVSSVAFAKALSDLQSTGLLRVFENGARNGEYIHDIPNALVYTRVLKEFQTLQYDQDFQKLGETEASYYLVVEATSYGQQFLST